MTAAGSSRRRWVRLTTRRSGPRACSTRGRSNWDPPSGSCRRCFDRDDVGGDRSDRQRRGDAGDDVVGGHRAVQQEDVDQRSCAASVPVGLPGGRSERFVSGREDTSCSSVGKSGRTRESAGLVKEDLEAVVQVHALPVHRYDARVSGYLGAALEEDHL